LFQNEEEHSRYPICNIGRIGLVRRWIHGSSAAASGLVGLWVSLGADITVALSPGQEISLTPYGAERYKKVDQADSPSYRCLPYGPTRGLSSPEGPYMILQTPGVVAILIERVDYRVIYLDGRGHPDDILDYPEWMGHSIYPFTCEKNVQRMAKDTRMMPGRCADGEGSYENAQHGQQGPVHKNPPKMSK